MKRTTRVAGAVLSCILSAGLPAYAGDSAASLDQRYVAHEARIDARMSEFHQELQITPAQETLWHAYAGAVHRNLEDARNQMVLEIQHTPATAPEHFESMLALKERQLKNLRDIAGTFNALYLALSSEQKRLADEHFARARAAMLKQAEGR